jgi:hypothetical protein
LVNLLHTAMHCISLFISKCIARFYYFIRLYNATFIAECIAIVYLLQN